MFPETRPAIVWPAPPDKPRIRYVGQLTGEASLGRKPAGLAALSALIEGPPPATAFSTPTAVAVRGEQVFVTDPQLGCMHVLDLEQRSYGAIRRAGDVAMEWPIDVAVTDNAVAVADSRAGEVFLFDFDGSFRTTIGRGQLNRPAAVAFDRQAGELFVLDTAGHDVAVFGVDGELKRRFGTRGSGHGEFNFPSGMCWRDMLVVADAMNFRAQVLDRAGGPMAAFGRKGDAAGDFALPRDVAVDSEGHIYVLDNQFENVQIFERDGSLLMAFGREGRGPGEFYLPSGITIDERDRIWVADTYNRRVQVFQYLREEGT